MKYINQIAYNLDRRDEEPNQELARTLAEENNHEGIKEIAGYLHDKNKSIQSDCLKVLYEIGYIKPNLIAEYLDEFIYFLNSKNNRMVWGSMIALANLAEVVPEKIYKVKELIFENIKTGSVITNVWGVYTIINLSKADKKYYDELKPMLFKLQKECRPIDFAKRSEAMIEAIHEQDLKAYIEILKNEKENLSNAGAKRVEKVIRKWEK